MNGSPTIEAVQEQIDWLVFHQAGIEEALGYANNTATFDDVAQKILIGKAALYANEDSFVITEIIHLPRAKFLNMWLVGGDLDAVLAWEDHLINLAHNFGCTHLAGSGRRGWERVMERQGWEFFTTTMIKEVNHGIH